MGEVVSLPPRPERLCDSVWYSTQEPTEELEAGILLGAEDFRDACELTGQNENQGIYVFHMLVAFLVRESGDTQLSFAVQTDTYTFHTYTYSSEHIYIETQSVQDILERLEFEGGYVEGIGEKSMALIKATLYEDISEPE